MVLSDDILLVENSNTKLELDQIVSDVDDVTEPSSIDKVLEYAEQIQEEDEHYMQQLTQKLHNAVVYWEQPWYQEENILGHRHKTLREDDDGSTYRNDAISKEEHDLIAKNWHKLRKRFGIPDKIISFARWRSLDKTRNPKLSIQEQVRRFVTAFLARGLKRNLHQVYRHIKSYYGGHRKGPFSATEEKIIEICFHHKPKSIGRILSTVLGREPRAINKRLFVLQNGRPEKKRLKWNLSLATKFLQNLLKYSELELDELKNRKFEKWIWRRLGDDMDQDDSYLQHFWYCYLHVQLFVKCDVKLNQLKKKIFKKLRVKVRENAYKIWSDIRWKDVARDFPDGYTPRFLYRISNYFIKSFKGYLRAPLADVIDYALEKNKSEKNKKKNKRLKTLRLNDDGQLELVDYRS